MKTLPTGFLLCACLILGTMVSVDSQQNNDLLKSISEGIERFSITLLLRTAMDIGDDNFVVSPLSVWTMLTVLSEGAQNLTFKELSLVLRHPKTNDKTVLRQIYRMIERTFLVNTSTVELASTNRFFVDVRNTILPQYESLLRQSYATDISKVDFRNGNTVNYINQMISRDTRGKITELVNRDDLADATMILTNAVFFKGQWSLPFNSSLTKVENFHNFENQVIGRVNMMYQRGPFPYVNMPEFQAHVVELPYGKENRLSMIVMIPYYRMSLAQTFQKFTEVHMKKVIDSLSEAAIEYEDDEVDVYLPRFNIDSDLVLNKILNNMGIYDVFDSNYSDLSGISNQGRLFLSRVIHKARIEVNEEGTVASAVTAGELSNRNTPPKVVANKPFLYFIYEKTTKIIVFGGTYKTPSLV